MAHATMVWGQRWWGTGVLCLVAAAGLALGSIRFRGVGLGVAGALFAGILYAHLAWSPEATLATAERLLGANHELSESALTAAITSKAQEIAAQRHQILDFVREFGLILFVYAIGMQVGPGFISNLKANGLAWNGLAACVVLGGLACTWALHHWGGISATASVGVMSGAVTNTPGLAAAQQAVADLVHAGVLDPDAASEPGIGYAIAYPFGVIGIILTMIAIRAFFRIDPAGEARALADDTSRRRPLPANRDVEVLNPGLEGRTITEITDLVSRRVVISRVLRQGETISASQSSRLALGDIVHCVGRQDDLDRLELAIGKASTVDVRTSPSNLAARRLLVTERRAIGRPLAALDLRHRFGVNVTRVARAGVEFVASPQTKLQFGDTLVAVGNEQGLLKLEAVVGNSTRVLEHPQLLPIFIGIALGVLLGSIPLAIPGMPAPVKLGLAGGPLVVALLLSRTGRWGPLNFYVPHSANIMLRELGIALFLSCVGLKAGEAFVETLMSGDGLWWMAAGAMITLIPLSIAAIIARCFMGMNYAALSGVMAGSMTDPPALAFANASCGGEEPAIAYASVYPLTMVMRVVGAQIFVLLLA
ncbi:MAG: putative transporter [Planctomycetota bacterium]|nr:MAG: putative transporter [Planctomycetota bacterium]